MKLLLTHLLKYKKENRHIVLSISCLLVLSAISITTASNTVQTNTDQSSTILQYSFDFIPPQSSVFSTDNHQFTKLDLSGCISLAPMTGAPSLPIKFIQIALPPFTQISNIEVYGQSQTLILENINLIESPILPQQPSIPLNSNAKPEFTINKSLYSSPQLFPSNVFSDYDIGYARGIPIVSLALHPIQYNPAEGKLYYYPNLMVSIELSSSSNINQFFRGIPNDLVWTQSLVSNPQIINQYKQVDGPSFGYPGGLCDPSENYDYVIITTTHNGLDYWTTSGPTPYNWESLMDKHEAVDDLDCTLVTIQDITACTDYHNTDPLFNDLCAHIREFCKDAYEDWGTQYILIGGDDEWITAREMDTSYETNINSDIYWSNLDSSFNEDHDYYWGEEGDSGFDMYSELFIGRLTCDIPQDVSNWIKKSFYYLENNDLEYLDNAAFYGGNTGWNCEGDDFMDFSAIKGTNDWLGPNPHSDGPWPTWLGFLYGFETFNKTNPGVPYDLSVRWTAEPPNPGWQGGSESTAITGLRTAINNDQVTLLSGIAHANSQMSLDVYASNWESNYHNTKPFFLHDYGCHCGDMDASDDGILHSMLFHSDTELAFGVVFNTCYGWGNFDSTNSSSALQTKLFWDYFFDTANNSLSPSNWQLGKGHAWSKDIMAPTLNWGHTWRAVIQGCLLFADPAQLIKPPRSNSAPDLPDAPSGPTEGPVGIIHTFSTMTKDPDGDQVLYKFDWGDGLYSDWLGPFDSEVTITGNHSWFKQGTFNVRVKAKDLYGMSTQWSQPSPIYIGAADIKIGPISGGFAKLSIDFTNNGTADAYNLHWTVITKGGIASLLTNQVKGTINLLNLDETVTINPISDLFGLGRIQITVDARADHTSGIMEQVTGFIIGPFVLL